MLLEYKFKDSATSDKVAKALLFVARFSREQALVKFGENSVTVIWGDPLTTSTYYIHAEAAALDMFSNKLEFRHRGLNHCIVVQVDPTVLGKTLKGCASDKSVTLAIIQQNNLSGRLKVTVEHSDNAPRAISHTIPCEIKSLEDYKHMYIGEMEKRCRYHTRTYIDCIQRFKKTVECFFKLNTSKISITSKLTDLGNEVVVYGRNQGSNIKVTLAELENGLLGKDSVEMLQGNFVLDESQSLLEAGVLVDTKKLSAFLSGLAYLKKNKISLDIEHNMYLKVTLDYEAAGEKFIQSLLLTHSMMSR